MSPDSRKMEFLVARYAPDLTGRINVGIVLFERTTDGFSFAKARFTRNLRRISTFDEDADIDVLQSIFDDIERDVNSSPERIASLLEMQATLSNGIQFSDPKGTMVLGDPESEVDRLVSLYLPPEPAQT